MYVGRTSEIKIMTDFDNFHHDLIELVKKYEHDLAIEG